MGFEKRNGRGMYYYRKLRIGDRVVSIYLGKEGCGHLAATANTALQRRRKRIENKAQDKEWCDARVLESDIATLDDACHVLRRTTAKLLEDLGFHNHKGEWRLRRTK